MIISIFNEKGGVAKTTTAINLSATLAQMGKKVLLMDLDAQRNATRGSGEEEGENMFAIMKDEMTFNEGIIHTKFCYDLIPSNKNITNADISLGHIFGREQILKKKISSIQDQYDYIIMDCPGYLGLMAVNALVCSDYIMIPIYLGYFSVTGVADLFDTYDLIKGSLNPNLKLKMLITMFDKRKGINKATKEELYDNFGDNLYKTVIRTDTQIENAQGEEQPINFYNTKSKGYEDYMKLAKEVLKYE